MMVKRKIPLIATALILLCICFSGCKSDSRSNTDGQGSSGSTLISAVSGEITLNGSSISAGSGVSVDGTTATITKAGTYEITGSLEDGQILVDASGEVTIILNNADITCSTSSPIYVKEAKKVVITLADGSVNSIIDGSSYDLAEAVTEPDAALYSKADMVINGTGSLTVTANYNDGITGKDTLLIESGAITVSAVNHGIKGKDYLMINGGNIIVTSGGDGMKATNDTEASLGYVEINGGTIGITANDEGISAVTSVTITDGLIAIDTSNNGVKSDGLIDIQGGTVEIQAGDDGLICNEQNISDAASFTVNCEIISAT